MNKVLAWVLRLGVIGVAVLLLAVSLWKTSQKEWLKSSGGGIGSVNYWFGAIGDNIKVRFLSEEEKKDFWCECADKRLATSFKLAKKGEYGAAVRMLEKAEYYLLRAGGGSIEQREEHLKVAGEIKEMVPVEMKGVIDYWTRQVEVLQK